MGQCIQSVRKTLDEAHRRREEAREKQKTDKYKRIKLSTQAEYDQEERQYLEYADKVAEYDAQLTELEQDTQLRDAVRKARKKAILTRRHAVQEQMKRVEPIMISKARAVASVETGRSLLVETKQTTAFLKLHKALPDLQPDKLSELRDKKAEAIADMEEAASDLIETGNSSDFACSIDVQLEDSEKRQAQISNSTRAWVTTKPAAPSKTLTATKPPVAVSSSSSARATPKTTTGTKSAHSRNADPQIQLLN